MSRVRKLAEKFSGKYRDGNIEKIGEEEIGENEGFDSWLEDLGDGMREHFEMSYIAGYTKAISDMPKYQKMYDEIKKVFESE